MKCGPQLPLTGCRNPCHYPHSKENSWGMSLILVGLLLPLERASCHCQGQTLSIFCPESRHIYSALCSAHLDSHHTSCSFPFPFPFFSPCPSVIRCPGIAHWSHIQPLTWVQAHKNTQKKRKKKTLPCYHDLLEMYLVVSSFFLSRF